MNFNVKFSQNSHNVPVTLKRTDISGKTTFDNVVVIPVETDHASLQNRDAADSHPISAISLLGAELDGKLDDDDVQALTNLEIEALIKNFV